MFRGARIVFAVGVLLSVGVFIFYGRSGCQDESVYFFVGLLGGFLPVVGQPLDFCAGDYIV